MVIRNLMIMVLYIVPHPIVLGGWHEYLFG